MRNRWSAEALPFFLSLLATELDDTAVKSGGLCKPTVDVWLVVTTLFVDGVGVHEDLAQCRGSTNFLQTQVATTLGGTVGVERGKNDISNTFNIDQYLHCLLSFVPPSGIESDLDAYVNDPASHQPMKKALCRDRMSLITATRSTSTSTSPKMYTNKRTAISSPAKGAMASCISNTSLPREDHSLLVTSHIMVLGTCVWRHGTKISTCKIHRYQCMCKMVASLYAAVEIQRRIFC